MGRSVATSAGIFGSNNPSRGHQRAGVKTFFLIKQQKHRQSTALAEPIRTRWLMAACAHFFCMISVSQNFIFLLWSAVRPSGLIGVFFATSQTRQKKCAYIANTYTVRTGSARAVDCRCFCCFVRKQVFSPTRWRPLLGLFQLKIAAKAALNNDKLIYCPLLRSHSTKKQHADTRN